MQRGALGLVVERDVAVPMRDGVVLRAHVFRPEAEGRFPGILLRTPYGKPADGFERYVRAGYVVVTQDSRGRYASDGEYVPFTVEETGDAEDGYDSVEWLATQPFCDGRIVQRLDAVAARPLETTAFTGDVCLYDSTRVDRGRLSWWFSAGAANQMVDDFYCARFAPARGSAAAAYTRGGAPDLGRGRARSLVGPLALGRCGLPFA